MRVEGERVYRLPPLQSPPVATGISAEEALRFPAVQLFVERTAAAVGEFALSDADAPLVADICLKLDGIPLALEFARLGSLIAKSLVVAEMGDPEPRLRLLQTTRVYAREKLTESREHNAVARRHAEYIGGDKPSSRRHRRSSIDHGSGRVGRAG